MNESWYAPFTARLDMPPFQTLQQKFDLTGCPDWLQAEGLNVLAKRHGVSVPNFVCQSQVNFADGYYEQIIFEQGVIPTRPDNWHDLFNGLIWLQFPKTKSLLNRLHVDDIQRNGLSPRSPQRNRITHFDECGIVLVTDNNEVTDALAEHQWERAFVKSRELWGNGMTAFVFGHANLEMLLNPFIGLTGKWLHLHAPDDFSDWDYDSQLSWVDNALSKDIEDKNLFTHQGCLRPIPLLGIPHWWDANCDPTFYDNQDYFRPKRKAK